MTNYAPILAPFVEKGGGTVLYKAYPPHRGDDISALIELAQAMPPGTKFVPIQPRYNLVTDLRVLLPDLVGQGLLGEGLVLTELAGTRAKRALSDQPRKFHAKSESQLIRLVRRALDWSKMPGKTPEGVVADLRQANPGLYEAFLVWIEGDGQPPQEEQVEELAHLVEQQKGDGPGLYKGILDWIEHNQQFSSGEKLERFVHIPPDKPLLVLGRPDLFRRFDDDTSPLRTVLDGAAYPNRFDLPGRERGAQQGQYVVRDLKSRLTYQVASDQWMDADVGFVFANVGENGQWVIVASGASSLGTFCAAHLLSQDRSGFGEAVERCREAEGGRPVDIGFACRYTQLSRYRPFRHVIEPDDLQIDLLNPRDLDGYRWLQRNDDEFKCLTDSWDPKESPAEPSTEPSKSNSVGAEPLQDPYMQWTWSPVWKDEEGGEANGNEPRVIEVEVKAKTVVIPGRRPIIQSEPLGRLIDRIEEDVVKDSGTWLERLGKGSAAGDLRSFEEMREDPSFQTVSPILLLGETGTGKKWITELIAKLWGGQTLLGPLEKARERWEDKKGRSDKKWNPHRALPALVNVQLAEWADRARGGDGRSAAPPVHDSLHTVAILDRPRDLLESELYGIYAESATDVRAGLGAFLSAGTGVLLLDEFLELDPGMQAGLLVVLDNGRVHPVGGVGAYPYLSRVVAATNRASNAAELQRLIHRDEVRTDLVARFPRRYEIPSLADRPREIIPILAGILDQAGGGGHLRISRAAFDALVCYSYPENIRELEALAHDFPDELVENCTKPVTKGCELKPENAAIRLQHLERLGVADCRPGLRHESIKCERETEDEFYVFEIVPLSQPEVEPASEPTDESAPVDPVVRFLREFKESQESRLEKLWGQAQKCSQGCLEGPDLHRLCERDCFRELVRDLHARLCEDKLDLKQIKKCYSDSSWPKNTENKLLDYLPLNPCARHLADDEKHRRWLFGEIKTLMAEAERKYAKAKGVKPRKARKFAMKCFCLLTGKYFDGEQF